MKILVLANMDIGLWNFRKEVLEAFLNRGDEVCVSVPPGQRVKDIEALGCRIDYVDLNRRGTNPLADLKLYFYYRKLIKREKPDVVLSYTIKPNVYGGLAASQLAVPYIANITGLGSAVENPGKLQKLTVGMYKYALRKANCIFFQNRGNEQFFVNHGITMAPHRLLPGSGVNLDKFRLSPYPKDGKIKFLFISRLLKEKGIEEYFAAAEYFVSRREDVEFHILGACEENYALQLEELSKKGIIKYHGLQLDVQPYIESTACLIHPSYYPEGMSNVILESAAKGRPVITTLRYGCKETVDDGVTGFLFKERDRQGLIDCIEKFLALTVAERETMGLAARKKMEKEFDRNIVKDAYINEVDKSVKQLFR